MTAIKNLPLRVRENLKKAYDMQLERATNAMKALKTHSDVVIKDGNAAEKLRDEALQVDNRTLGLRRGIRKMEEQQAKRTEYMLKTILKNAKGLQSGFKRAVPSDSQDDVGTGSTGATGSTGTTGSTGATGVSEYTASTGSYWHYRPGRCHWQHWYKRNYWNQLRRRWPNASRKRSRGSIGCSQQIKRHRSWKVKAKSKLKLATR